MINGQVWEAGLWLPLAFLNTSWHSCTNSLLEQEPMFVVKRAPTHCMRTAQIKYSRGIRGTPDMTTRPIDCFGLHAKINFHSTLTDKENTLVKQPLS